METKTLRNLALSATFATTLLFGDFSVAQANTTSNEVSIFIKGDKRDFVTQSTSIEDFLKEINVEIESGDTVIPALDTPIEKDTEILVIKSEKNIISEEEAIPYITEERFSFDLKKGERKVIQKGHVGKKIAKIEEELKNGLVTNENILNEYIETQPITEIVLVGTKEVITKKIPFTEEIKENSSMYKGERKIVQKGKQGLKEEIYSDNGIEKKSISSTIKSKPVNQIIEIGTKEKPVEPKIIKSSTKIASSKTTSSYTLTEFKREGVVLEGGRKYTYYSQSVLPGGGLKIPGRHVNSGGYVSDSNGYIVLAAGRGVPKGTVINTPFGYQGKVYDTCASCDSSWFDVYIK